MKLKFYFLSLCIGLVMGLDAQDLKRHQWKNRVILIIANDSESQIYRSQIEEFKATRDEFEERQLIKYYILPNTYKFENETENSWLDSSELFAKYNASNSNFKIILIGLDGGIKIEQNQLLTSIELFSTIDGMPMRRSELKNRP